jgi:WD40 repeat protein
MSHDAIGITPERAQEILDIPIVGAETTLDSGVIVTKHDGTEIHLVGEIATKSISSIGSFDSTIADVVVPEWLLPFSDNLKLADPASLPAGIVQGVSWSPDGVYLAVGLGITPFVSVYKRAGTTLTKLAALPTWTSPSTILDLEWSPNGQYLAIATQWSPCLVVFKRSGDTFTKVYDPAIGPSYGGTTPSVSWAPNGSYILSTGLVATGIKLTLFKAVGDSITGLPSPAEYPTGNTQSSDWTADSQYVAVGHSLTPFVSLYKRAGDVITKLPNPVTLPAGSVNGVAWSPDGIYLALAHAVSPYVSFYKRSGDTLIKLDNPASFPSGIGRDCTWSYDGRYIAVAHDTTPYVDVYVRDGDVISKLPDLPTPPTGHGQDVEWSPDGKILAAGHTTTPFIATYLYASDVYGGVPIRIE